MRTFISIREYFQATKVIFLVNLQNYVNNFGMQAQYRSICQELPVLSAVLDSWQQTLPLKPSRVLLHWTALTLVKSHAGAETFFFFL